MPATTSCKFGDVVLVSFPFTNLQSTKKRPAVVINSADYARLRPDVIVLAITSQVQTAPAHGERLIADWMRAGLLKTSAFKPLIATIERASVLRGLGRLTEQDQESLLALLREILGNS